jgi:hypothetical protein
MCVWGECITALPIYSLGTGWECPCQWTVSVYNIERISCITDELLAPTELHSVKVFSARVHTFPCRINFSWNYLNFFLIWMIFLCKSINDLQRISHITPILTGISSIFAGPSGRGLRCRSTAARLLRSWVPIPLGAWMFVCCVCCQIKLFATSWSLVQVKSYRLWCVVVCEQ